MAQAKKKDPNAAANPKTNELGPAAEALLALQSIEDLKVPPRKMLAWVEETNQGQIQVGKNPRVEVQRVPEGEGMTTYTCWLTGREFRVRSGDVIPVLVYEQVDGATGEIP